MTVVSFSPRP